VLALLSTPVATAPMPERSDPHSHDEAPLHVYSTELDVPIIASVQSATEIFNIVLALGVTAEEGAPQGGSAGGGSLFAASRGRRKRRERRVILIFDRGRGG
jgi:hypothetical protein